MDVNNLISVENYEQFIIYNKWYH